MTSQVAAAPVFTVDVEDWFQVNAFESYVHRSKWDTYESRVESNTLRLLDLMAETSAKGTFFTLGWVAERRPALIRAILDQGHEIASHGYWHQRIPLLSEAEFRDDVRRAKTALENAGGRAVLGYRAPSFSLTDDVEWAPRVLVEEGHQYDSSRFPIARRGYGRATGSRAPHVISTPSGPLREYPPAVWIVGGVRVPVAGGGWFRQFPLSLISQGLRAVLAEGLPAVFYIHPWEIDPNQPRMRVPFITGIRHYRGLAGAAQRLRILLQAFPFRSMQQIESQLV